MNALVVGASGQLGADLVAVLAARGFKVVGTHCSRGAAGTIALDIRDRQAAARSIAETAADVVFLAHNTPGGVDYCEEHPEEAMALLTQGTRNMLDAAAPRRARVVFFSSDYVFDGQAGPYDEQARPCPVSAYGRAKLAAERLVEAYPHGRLIIRTTAVFSWAPGTKNFAMQVWENLRAGKAFRVPDDQWCNPTLADFLAEAAVSLVQGGHDGVFNVVGRDWLPRSELGLALARAMSLDASLIRPVPTSELRQRARRPLKGGLKTDKLREALGSEPPGLAQALERFSLKFRQTAHT